MNDLLFRSLDDLAARADSAPAADRIDGIRARARHHRRRRQLLGTGAAALALAAIAGIVTLTDQPSSDGGPGFATDPTTSTPSPTTSEPAGPRGLEISDVRLSWARDDGGLVVTYRLHGESAAWSDPGTGEVLDFGGPQNTRVYADGKDVAGSDGGYIECEPTDRVVQYDERFGGQGETLPLDPRSGRTDTIRIEAPYCMPDGSLRTAVAEVPVP